MLEGRIDKQAKSLWKDAAERVSDGLADISVAVLYAPHLLSASSLACLREQLVASFRASRRSSAETLSGSSNSTPRMV